MAYLVEYLVPVVCVHIKGVSPIQGAGLEGSHCMYLPSFHSLVAGLMKPNSSLGTTAFGLRSTHMGFFFIIWYVLFRDLNTLST